MKKEQNADKKNETTEVLEISKANKLMVKENKLKYKYAQVWEKIPRKERKFIKKNNELIIPKFKKLFLGMWILVAVVLLMMIIFPTDLLTMFILISFVVTVIFKRKEKNVGLSICLPIAFGFILSWFYTTNDIRQWRIEFIVLFVLTLIGILGSNLLAALIEKGKIKASRNGLSIRQEMLLTILIVAVLTFVQQIFVDGGKGLIIIALAITAMEYVKAYYKKLIQLKKMKFELPSADKLALKFFLYNGNTMYKEEELKIFAERKEVTIEEGIK